MAQELTAQTENNQFRPINMGLVQEIWESDYDEEVDMFSFELAMYNGDVYRLSLKSKQIKEFNLFMLKEQANKRWVDHIMQK